jgi:D-sedoheptulose 7-phosphate isomerase
MKQNIDKEEYSNFLNKIKQCKGRLFIVGNGGSAATASHFTCDLVKFTKYNAICLNDSITQLTMACNDYEMKHMYSRLLDAQCPTEDDLVIIISGSGNSENLIGLAEYCAMLNYNALYLLGKTGGKVKVITKQGIYIQSQDQQIVEDIHMIICHSITKELIEEN